MVRVLIVTGEASGDRLGAAVVAAIRAMRPDVAVRGVTGPALRQAGVASVGRAEDLTAVGLVEAVQTLPAARRMLGVLDAEIASWSPDVVLTIDSPGLLLRVGRRARRRGVRVVHLVCPQVWAWRPGRVHRIAAAVDVLLCLLPHEPAWFAGTGLRAVFVGHPSAALGAVPRPAEDEALSVGLAPGSRPSEIGALWPVMRQTAAAIRRQRPDTRFLVARAPTVPAGALTGLDGEVVEGIGALAGRVHVALTATGTATLDLAAAGIPQVACYRAHPLTWAVGRRLVSGVRHLALPNVLAGAAVVPEHLQELDPEILAAEVLSLCGAPGNRQLTALRPLLAMLRGEGAVLRIAREVLGPHAPGGYTSTSPFPNSVRR